MFSENWLDVSLTNQSFLFYLYHGKKKTIKFFEAKRACVSTVLIELHTDCSSYFEEFEPLTSTLSLPAFLGWVSVQIIIFESFVTFFFFLYRSFLQESPLIFYVPFQITSMHFIPNYFNAFMAAGAFQVARVLMPCWFHLYLFCQYQNFWSFAYLES